MREANSTHLSDHLLGAALMTIYLFLLIATSSSIGMSRDEGFYAFTAERYALWFEALITHQDKAFHKDFIDGIWKTNHEHPALFKSLFSLAYLLHKKWDLFPQDTLIYRFFGMLSAGLLLWLTYIFGVRTYGRMAGLFSALCLAFIPRFFYHAHLAAFDVPIVLMVTAVTYAYYRSLTNFKWAIITGLLFGMALATKHNSWIVPIVLAIHFIWIVICENRNRRLGNKKTLSLIPWWFFSMMIFGPIIFIGSWPWIWTDTWDRLAEYVTFHTHHVYYNMAYLGVNYFRPPFPISYPWVMTLFTVPVTTILLGLVGLFISAQPLFNPIINGRQGSLKADIKNNPQQVTILFIGSLLTPIVVISMPWTPIFGGTKHWLTAYPFLALFAGLAFARVVQRMKYHLSIRTKALAPCICLVLLIAPSLVETHHSHPFGLSHYGFAAGFIPGSADLGMNRQFWGFTTRSMVDYFIKNLPNGGTVWICDTTYKAWQMLWRDGVLPQNIHPVQDISRADLAIVHHEHHFAEVDYQIWTLYGEVRPSYVLLYDSVPIISVYKNPHKI